MRTRTIKNYVLFELSMKGLTLLLISPLLNACIQAYLSSRGQPGKTSSRRSSACWRRFAA